MLPQGLPYELAIRCGRPNRRSPDKPCGYRLCMGVLAEEITYEPGLPFRYYVSFARSRVLDREVDHHVEDRIGSSGGINRAYEIPLPEV